MDYFHAVTYVTGTVQYNTVQYSIVEYNSVQYSIVEYNTVQYIIEQHSTVQYSTKQYSTVQHSAQQYSTAHHSTSETILILDIITYYHQDLAGVLIDPTQESHYFLGLSITYPHHQLGLGGSMSHSPLWKTTLSTNCRETDLIPNVYICKLVFPHNLSEVRMFT